MERVISDVTGVGEKGEREGEKKVCMDVV